MQQYVQSVVMLGKMAPFKDEAAFEQMLGNETIFAEIREAFPSKLRMPVLHARHWKSISA